MRSPRRGFLSCPGLMRSLENRRKDGDHDGIEILGGEGKSVWKNYHIKNSNPLIGDWNLIKTSFNIPDNIQTLKLVKIYVWNPGKEPVYIDDIDIEFR